MKFLLIPPKIQSSLLDEAIYTGFLFDWLLEALAYSANFIILIATGSIYLGTFLYINAMVKDMQMRFMSLESDSTIKPHKLLDSKQVWSIYVQEIEFHNGIIE